MGHSLSSVDGWWVVAAVALMGSAFLARGESWFTAVRAAMPQAKVGRAAVTRILLIGMAASTLAPGRAGEAARAYLLARRTGGMRASLSTAVGTLLSQTLLNVLALMILAVVAFAGSAMHAASSRSLAETVALPGAGVLILAVAPVLGSQAESIRPRRLRTVAIWVQRQLVGVRRGLAAYRAARTALHSGAFQLAAWALQLAVCWMVLRAFGLQDRAGVAAAAAVLVAVNITAVVPITPSNVGVFQAACIAVLAPFGVSAAQGLAYGLVLQAVEIVCALALGLPSLVHEGVSIGEIARRPGAVREPTAQG